MLWFSARLDPHSSSSPRPEFPQSIPLFPTQPLHPKQSPQIEAMECEPEELQFLGATGIYAASAGILCRDQRALVLPLSALFLLGSSTLTSRTPSLPTSIPTTPPSTPTLRAPTPSVASSPASHPAGLPSSSCRSSPPPPPSTPPRMTRSPSRGCSPSYPERRRPAKTVGLAVLRAGEVKAGM